LDTFILLNEGDICELAWYDQWQFRLNENDNCCFGRKKTEGEVFKALYHFVPSAQSLDY
jgi:hypothetical protein